jgi:mRNA interferase MazF
VPSRSPGEIRRGEIRWADLGEPRGSAPAHRRPVVIVQAEPYNRSRLATALVVVVTTNQRLAAMPGNVVLPAPATGLREDSVANATQLATIDRADLGDLIGSVPAWLMTDLDRGLRRVLDL